MHSFYSIFIGVFFMGLLSFTIGLSHQTQNPVSPCDITLGLYLSRYRNPQQINRMSSEDKRNTLIVELNKSTQLSIKELQGKNSCQLLDIFRQIDYARASLEKAINSRLHRRGFHQTHANKDQFHRCTHAIAQWGLGMLMFGLRSGRLVTGKHEAKGVRIDNQSGIIKHDGADYYNIQVQIGGETFATALVPAGIELGQRKIRNALVQSLKSGHRAIIVAGERERRTWWVGLMTAAGGIAAVLAAM